MLAFIFRRLLSLIPLLLAVTLLVFLLMSLAPGDFLTPLKMQRDIPAGLIEQLRHDYGLDQPWYVQYARWLGKAATLDFGYSAKFKVPVFDLIGQRLFATVLLSFFSMALAWLVAVPLGVLAAIHKDSIFDRFSSFLAYAALSVPEFFLALLAIYFAARTGWFPLGGATSLEHDFLPLAARVGDRIHHLVLPVVVLGIGSVAGLMRVMRANFLDAIRADYVQTARAKGVPEGWVMFKHVLRNAINPLVSSLGFAFSGLLSGSLVVEIVMNYPGLGNLIYQAFLSEDRFVVLASILISCVMLVVGNLLADLCLAWSDPRIRLETHDS